MGRILPETAFLVIGATAGLFFVVAVPAYQGADEPAHLNRAYQVSTGGILAERRGDLVGGMLPASMKARHGSLQPAQQTFVDFRNTALIPPVPYLPHALALAPGRTMELPPRVLLYLARLAGLVTALGIVFLAIRITPIAKRVFLLLALTPMAIRQMSMVSADTVTNAASLLLLAMLLRLSVTSGGSHGGPTLVRLVLCSLTVSLSKLAYLPFTLLYCICPAVNLGGRRRYVIGFVVLAGTTAVACGAWLWATHGLYAAQRIAPDADPHRQLVLVFADPARFVRILLADLQRDWRLHLSGMGFPGQLPRWLSWLQLGVTAVVALLDGRTSFALSLRAKAVVVFVFVATYVLINAMAYLGFNPIGAPTVRFVQSRYYIPIAPLPFLLLSNRRGAALLEERQLTVLAACFGAFSSIVGMRWVLERWHGF